LGHFFFFFFPFGCGAAAPSKDAGLFVRFPCTEPGFEGGDVGADGGWLDDGAKGGGIFVVGVPHGFAVVGCGGGDVYGLEKADVPAGVRNVLAVEDKATLGEGHAVPNAGGFET
jgi:hypothetical protein